MRTVNSATWHHTTPDFFVETSKRWSPARMTSRKFYFKVLPYTCHCI
jgi:hypothetical protein